MAGTSGAYAHVTMTDLDIPGLAGTVREAEERLLEHFKATDVSIDTSPSGTHENVTIRLQFRGFTGFGPALERVGEVAHQLDELEATDSIKAGVDTDGQYDPHYDEMDDRPAGWVNADIEV